MAWESLFFSALPLNAEGYVFAGNVHAGAISGYAPEHGVDKAWSSITGSISAQADFYQTHAQVAGSFTQVGTGGTIDLTANLIGDWRQHDYEYAYYAKSYNYGRINFTVDQNLDNSLATDFLGAGLANYSFGINLYDGTASASLFNKSASINASTGLDWTGEHCSVGTVSEGGSLTGSLIAGHYYSLYYNGSEIN